MCIRDSRYLGTQERRYDRGNGTEVIYKQHSSEAILSALKLGARVATLTDGQDVAQQGYSPYRHYGGVYGIYDDWGMDYYPGYGYQTNQKKFLSDGSFVSLRKSSRSDGVLDRVSASTSGRLLRTSRILPYGSIVDGQITGISESGDGSSLLMIRKSKKAQLIKVASDLSITPIKVKLIDSAFDKGAKAEFVKDMPRSFYAVSYTHLTLPTKA